MIEAAKERTSAAPELFRGQKLNLPWARIAKLGAAALVLAIGLYAITADQFAIATDSAVVSAYSIAVRSPIDGVVSGSKLTIGERVERGAVLAEVANDRIDDQHLVDLREHLAGARSQLSATNAEEDALATMRAELEGRAQAYVDASVARLQGSVAEAESMLAASTERRDEAERILNRRVSLSQGGFASAADLDKAKSDFNSASHEAAAQSGRLAALRAQLAAAKQGVVSEPGSNDVAYSRQRADEIAIRLRDLAQQRAIAAADIDETTARLASEEARVGKLREAALTSPISGMVWKVNASPGERIAAGGAIAQIVDCDAAFIIAQTPQNRVPDIAVGGEAEFRLSGDNLKRRGRILSVTGDATGGDHNLAAAPFESKGATATVRIAIEPAPGECFVGRTARVLIPSSGPGLLSRILGLLH